MNIGEYCPEQNIIFHELASAIWFIIWLQIMSFLIGWRP